MTALEINAFNINRDAFNTNRDLQSRHMLQDFEDNLMFTPKVTGSHQESQGQISVIRLGWVYGPTDQTSLPFWSADEVLHPKIVHCFSLGVLCPR